MSITKDKNFKFIEFIYHFNSCFGISLIILSFLFNPYIVPRILSSDGVIAESTIKLIYIIELLLLSTGLCILAINCLFRKYKIIENLVLKRWIRLSWFQNAGLLIAGTLVACVLVEAWMRLFNPFNCYGDKDLGWPLLIRTHEKLGFSGIPNANALLKFGNCEALYTLNSKGYRDSDHNYRNENNRFRIVLLGDSFGWGYAVKMGESFARRLERVNENIEVINLSQPAYGTSHELVVLLEEGIKYRPDMVLLLYYMNDPRDNMEAKLPQPKYIINNGKLEYLYTQLPKASNPADTDLIDADEPGDLEERKVDISIMSHAFWTPLYNVKNHFYDVFYQHFHLLRDISLRMRNLKQNVHNGLMKDFTDLDLLYGEDSPAWILTRALLKEIHDISVKNGSKFLLVLIPEKVQLFKSVSKGNKMIGYQLRVKKFAEQNEIDVLDLLPLFKKSWKRLYYRLDNHWNPEGHRLAAEETYKFMIKAGLLNVNGVGNKGQ